MRKKSKKETTVIYAYPTHEQLLRLLDIVKERRELAEAKDAQGLVLNSQKAATLLLDEMDFLGFPTFLYKS
jgi:hypothetical protein